MIHDFLWSRQMTDDLMSVTEVADAIGAVPKSISDLFYRRKLDVSICPLIGGRRLIPRSYVPKIEAELLRLGKLPQNEPQMAMR